MADEVLKSNMVIGTEFRKPNTEPLSSAHKALERIEKRLVDLTNRKWKITLEIDDSQIRALGFTMQRQQRPPGGGPGGGGFGGSNPFGPGGGSAGRPGGNEISRQQTARLKEGALTSLEIATRQEKVQGNLLQIQKESADQVKDTAKSQTQVLDLIKQQDILEEKRAVRRRADALRRGRQARLAIEGQQLGASVREDIAAGRVPLTFERGGGNLLYERIAASERAARDRQNLLRSQVFPLERKEAHTYRDAELKKIDDAAAAAAKAAQQEVKLNQEQDKIIAAGYKKRTLQQIDDQLRAAKKGSDEEIKLLQQRDAIIADHHLKTNLRQIDDQLRAAKKGSEQEIRLSQQRDKLIADHHLKTHLRKIDDQLRLTQKGSQQEVALLQQRDKLIADNYLKSHLRNIDAQKRLDETQQRQILASQRRLSAREAGDYVRDQARGRAREILGSGADQLVQEGFQERAPTRVFNALTGRLEETRNLVRTTGNAWSGYTVEIARANTATNKMTVEVLTGARALRFMGDHLTSAIAKVGIWSVATSAVFGTISAIGLAASKIKELEENTVLLARVGQGFGRGNEQFTERLRIATRLTEQITELTSVYGGDAAEAQRAAAIFARSGRDQRETLEATRAALIATRIAELETEDAARLLSAAMLQFNLEARQLLPTLDGLNILSNTYRVTTDDLLQAISRTGSVIAEHNGRLEELASLTALVSQRTARTGAEIGNAFKTISSNLDRLDVQQAVFDKLGISTVNFEGEAKSLGQVLLEIQGRIETLTAAEQKQLTLLIAGTRQRNILISAIQTADQALIAENQILKNNSTATEEFIESAGTLSAALQRIYATLIRLAALGGGGLSTLVKSLINIADSLLRVLTLFDGLPAKTLGWIGTIYLMQRAVTLTTGWLGRMVASSAAVTASTAGNTSATTANAAAHTAAARAIAAHAAAHRAAQISGSTVRGMTYPISATTGMSNAGAAYAASLPGPSRGIGTAGILAGVGRFAGPIALGLTIAIPLLSQFAQAQNIATAEIDQSISATQNSIQLEERRRAAISRTVSAIADLSLQYQELSKQGKNAEAAEVQRRAVGIGASAGLNLSTGNLVGDATAQGNVLQQQSIERQREATKKLIADLTAKQAQNQERREILDNYLRNTEQIGFSELFTQASAVVNLPTEIQKYLGGKDYQGNIADNARGKVLSQYSNEALKLLEEEKLIQEEINKAKEEANNLERQGYDLKQNQARLSQLSKEQEESRQAFLKETKTQLLENYRLELDSTRFYEEKGGAYRRIVDLAKKEADNLEEILRLQKESDPQLQEAAFERANALLKQQLELYKEIQKVNAENGERNMTLGLGYRNQLAERSGLIFLQQARGLAGASSYGDSIAEIDLRRQRLSERISGNLRASQELDLSGPGANLGRAAALRKDTQEAINDLAQLEVDKRLAILEAEKEISIERKKQADQAARSLTTLSQEDKLRVIALGSYFNKNPGKTLSFEEQLSINSKGNQLLQQFYGGRLQDFDPASSPAAARLAAGGFGSTVDLERGTAEVARARGGRTDQQLLEGGFRAANALQAQAAEARGERIDGGFNDRALAPGLGVNRGSGKAAPIIDADIRIDAIDFKPLTDAFQTAVDVKIDAAVQRMADDVDRIASRIQALEVRRTTPNRQATP